mgnify:CR=1 FL=1
MLKMPLTGMGLMENPKYAKEDVTKFIEASAKSATSLDKMATILEKYPENA